MYWKQEKWYNLRKYRERCVCACTYILSSIFLSETLDIQMILLGSSHSSTSPLVHSSFQRGEVLENEKGLNSMGTHGHPRMVALKMLVYSYTLNFKITDLLYHSWGKQMVNDIKFCIRYPRNPYIRFYILQSDLESLDDCSSYLGMLLLCQF